MPEAIIESLDHEGRGVAHVDGKTIFIEGALPHEQVVFTSYRRKKNYELAKVTRIISSNALRVTPRCRHFGVCGGCSMQHFDAMGQAATKQRVLEDALWHVGRVRPNIIYPVIMGSSWAYRARARLTVRQAEKKGQVTLGFHEKRSSFIADILGCEVLPERVSGFLPLLKKLISQLSISQHLAQIEMAQGDAVTVLVLQNLKPLTATDENHLRTFADVQNIQFWLQPDGPESAHPFHPLEAPQLTYTIPDFSLTLGFRPTDFTQVNHGVNRALIRRAMDLLDPQPGERIGDMFCGLGNFTLPIARCGAFALGVEGSGALVERARENAKNNGLVESTSFMVANLFEATAKSVSGLGALDKLLIDPPRDGAMALVKALTSPKLKRIVYVSCDPATLARDAAVLVQEKGYRLMGAGIANMFPQTSHVESIALFEK